MAACSVTLFRALFRADRIGLARMRKGIGQHHVAQLIPTAAFVSSPAVKFDWVTNPNRHRRTRVADKISMMLGAAGLVRDSCGMYFLLHLPNR